MALLLSFEIRLVCHHYRVRRAKLPAVQATSITYSFRYKDLTPLQLLMLNLNVTKNYILHNLSCSINARLCASISFYGNINTSHVLK